MMKTENLEYLLRHGMHRMNVHQIADAFAEAAKVVDVNKYLLHALQLYLNAGSKEQRREASVVAKKAIEKALK